MIVKDHQVFVVIFIKAEIQKTIYSVVDSGSVTSKNYGQTYYNSTHSFSLVRDYIDISDGLYGLEKKPKSKTRTCFVRRVLRLTEHNFHFTVGYSIQ